MAFTEAGPQQKTPETKTWAHVTLGPRAVQRRLQWSWLPNWPTECFHKIVWLAKLWINVGFVLLLAVWYSLCKRLKKLVFLQLSPGVMIGWSARVVCVTLRFCFTFAGFLRSPIVSLPAIMTIRQIGPLEPRFIPHVEVPWEWRKKKKEKLEKKRKIWWASRSFP